MIASIDVRMQALNFRQCAGRAGRRGFDTFVPLRVPFDVKETNALDSAGSETSSSSAFASIALSVSCCPSFPSW